MRRLPLFFWAALLAVTLGSTGCNSVPRTRIERRGAQLYGQMCAVCHGPRGAGYKADQAPAITHASFLASVSDDFLRQAINNGRSGTTMSAWSILRGGPLSRADVDSIIAFLRTWDKRPHATLDERPLTGDTTRGSAVFAQECARCHGQNGVGGPYVNIGKVELLLAASNGFLRHAIREGRFGTAMPGFAAMLGDGTVEDLVALVRSWQSTPASVVQPPPSRPPPIPLGPVPLNPRGPDPVGFQPFPATTPADTIKGQLDRHARMALLDARAPSDYTSEHIIGAVSVPFYDPDPYVADLPKDSWLVCYCSCPHAESRGLAQSLMSKGFTKVTVLDEGLGVWKARKYGTESSGQRP
jgi:cytochrome c oxidase cbb3-type subunit 3/ubiquinol-cytochrome c reductase cytochrome c subunit